MKTILYEEVRESKDSSLKALLQKTRRGSAAVYLEMIRELLHLRIPNLPWKNPSTKGHNDLFQPFLCCCHPFSHKPLLIRVCMFSGQWKYNALANCHSQYRKSL